MQIFKRAHALHSSTLHVTTLATICSSTLRSFEVVKYFLQEDSSVLFTLGGSINYVAVKETPK